jgi:UDP-N-acetylmuramyl tripeptide synthase
VVRLRGKQAESLVSLRKIPVTYDGNARHNVANALAAAATADALRVPAAAISRGLCALRNEDNPGRANLYRVGEVTVLLDFAHNPAGLEALMPVINSLPAKRRLLVTGQAGDRGDADLRDFAQAIGSTEFDRIIIKRMDGHARGREVGEVAGIMRDAFLALGYAPRSLSTAKTELDATRAALRWARPGDLIVLLSHEKRDQTRELLAQQVEKHTP